MFKKISSILYLLSSFILLCNGQDKDTLEYVPIADYSNYIIVKASINGSTEGCFLLDTGLTSGRMQIDSAFFYNNIDTTDLVRINPKFKMYYWQAFYKGNILVNIGSRYFYVNEIEVNNQAKTHRDGLIGVEAFLNKVTIVDFDKKRIAFVDSISVDSSCIVVPLLPPKIRNKLNANQKFIEVDGFLDKMGRRKTGRFLLDTGCIPLGFILKESYVNTLDTSRFNGDRYQDPLLISNLDIGTVSIMLRKKNKDLSSIKIDAIVGGDGVAGMMLLRKYNFIADYKKNVLYLKPNKKYIFNRWSEK
jgi:hypothetical protein